METPSAFGQNIIVSLQNVLLRHQSQSCRRSWFQNRSAKPFSERDETGVSRKGVSGLSESCKLVTLYFVWNPPINFNFFKGSMPVHITFADENSTLNRKKSGLIDRKFSCFGNSILQLLHNSEFPTIVLKFYSRSISCVRADEPAHSKACRIETYPRNKLHRFWKDHKRRVWNWLKEGLWVLSKHTLLESFSVILAL